MIPDEIRRQFDQLKQGFTFVAGEFTLATSGTTTTITRQGVSSSSHISMSPLNAGAKAEGTLQYSRTKGAFTLTHTASATPRTYSYSVHTPTA